jgi:hypothetical protein
MTRHLMTLFFVLLVSVHAETLTLRTGTSVEGRLIGIDARQIIFQVEGQFKTYPRSDVLRVTFSPPVDHERPLPPADSPTPPAVGQTIEQVTATLGQPKVILDLGPKKIYVYPDLKVTFVDGKVSDVGH